MIPGVIGHYRILERVGSGGMGVVYKAFDSRLNRPVAIKALVASNEFAGDAPSILRREARAIAAIDHPYICKVYELLETPEQAILVMEFVEGETLARRLSQGVLSISDALRYGAEVAEALSEAHAKGVIHRDIKPANILITPHRHVKVMDFGIAKVRRHPSDETAEAPIEPDSRATFAGTPWYMSPEQAMGKALDHRTDIFSTGVLIYQCLTGDLPFEGTTPQRYLHNLGSQTPRPIRALSPDVPESLELAVARCLEIDPTKRTASAAELAAELHEIEGSITGGREAGIERSYFGTFRSRMIAGAVVLALLVSVWFLIQQWLELGERMVQKSAEPLVTWPSREQGSRISPDVQWISFLSDRGGKWNLWLQSLTGTEAKALSDPTGAVRSHVWSPDGKELACLLNNDGKTYLQVIPAFFGGSPRFSLKIEDPLLARELVRWVGDNIYVEIGGSLSRVNLKEGSLQRVTAFDDSAPRSRRHFDITPDEEKIVFSARVQDMEDLFVADPQGKNISRLTEDAAFDRYPRWIGERRRILFQSNRGGQVDLWHKGLDGRKPLQLTTSAQSERPEDLSRDGRYFTFREEHENSNLWAIHPGTGQEWRLTADARSDYWPSSSGAADVIAFQRSKPSMETGSNLYDAQIYVASLLPNTQLQAPREVAEGFNARVSADGRWLSYLRWSKRDSVDSELWLHDLASHDNRKLSSLLPLPGYSMFPVDWIDRSATWSPTEPVMWFAALSEKGYPEVWCARAGKGAERIHSLERTRHLIKDPRISHAGRYLSYIVRPESGGVSELRVNDLETGVDRILETWNTDDTRWPYSLGWLQDDSAAVSIYSQGKSDGTEHVRILQSSPSKGTVIAAEFDGAFATTARLDPKGPRIYLTRKESGAQNVFEISWPKFELRRITGNDHPGISFSGIEITRQGVLILSRVEKKQDIWLVQFEQ